MDLFSQPGSPLSLLSAGASPMGTTPRGLQPSPASGGVGGMLNLNGGTDQLPAMPFGQSSGSPGDIGAQIQAAGANATPAFWNQLEGMVGQGSAPPDASSISDLINHLLGTPPQLSDLFSSKPYENMISQLASNKASGQNDISASYAKALADLAATTADAQKGQTNYASQVAANTQQAQDSQQAFLQNMGIAGPAGTAMGNALSGQAAQMAQQAADQKNMAATINQVQNGDLAHTKQDVAQQQMAAMNYLSGQTAGAQGSVTRQEASDQSTAMKDLATMLASRQSQAGSLLNNAESFIDKNTTSANTRNEVEQQLNDMATQGDPTAKVVGSIIHGIPGQAYAAPDMASAMAILQDPKNGGLPKGVDANRVMQLLSGYYGNTTTKQTPPDMMDSLKQYLQALTGGGS